jgi:3-phenylpropionate/trans-cinnamate dioxygenase ferredoxin reductase component
MNRFKYLIVGGGMTSDSAVQGIRSVDASGGIGMIAAEPDPPYDRPPLSKKLWKGKPLEKIWRKTEARGVTLFCERRAVSLDAARKEVADDRGDTYRYDRLLLATGGTPRRFPGMASETIFFRTVQDYRKLRALASEPSQFVVIGGGFIGSEIAAALCLNGRQTTMVFPGSGVCAGLLPPDLAAFLNDYYADRGVRVIHGQGVTSVTPSGSGAVVRLANGNELAAGTVVAGLGLTPNTELASQAGLSVGNGILVDEQLRTSQPDVYAAGDVANFPCPALNKRIRVEHEDNANTMGVLAGRNMADGNEKYTHLPFFYSDLFDHGYEAVGETHPTLRIQTEWLEPNRKGAIFYLDGERVRGVLLWNIFGKVDAARELITAPARGRLEDLKAWTRERLIA